MKMTQVTFTPTAAPLNYCAVSPLAMAMATRKVFRTALANSGYFITLPDRDQGRRKATLSPVAIEYMTDLFASLLYDTGGKLRTNAELVAIAFLPNNEHLEDLQVALGHPEADGAAALAAYLVTLLDELGDERNYRWGLVEVKELVLTGVISGEDQMFTEFNNHQVWKVYPCRTITGLDPYPSGRPRYEEGLIRLEKLGGPILLPVANQDRLVNVDTSAAGYEISYDQEVIEGILACEAIAAQEGRLSYGLCYNDVAMWPGIDTSKNLHTNSDIIQDGEPGQFIVEFAANRMGGLANHYRMEEQFVAQHSTSTDLILRPHQYMVVTDRFFQGFVSMYRVSYPEDPRGVNSVFRSIREFSGLAANPDGSIVKTWQPVALQLEGPSPAPPSSSM